MKNGYDDSKITSISDARRKKAAAAKGYQPPRTARDWLVGGLFVAMALGMVVYAGLAVWQWLSTVSR